MQQITSDTVSGEWPGQRVQAWALEISAGNGATASGGWRPVANGTSIGGCHATPRTSAFCTRCSSPLNSRFGFKRNRFGFKTKSSETGGGVHRAQAHPDAAGPVARHSLGRHAEQRAAAAGHRDRQPCHRPGRHPRPRGVLSQCVAAVELPLCFCVIGKASITKERPTLRCSCITHYSNSSQAPSTAQDFHRVESVIVHENTSGDTCLRHHCTCTNSVPSKSKGCAKVTC